VPQREEESDMPGSFTFSRNFEDATIVSQTLFSPGAGVGIDDPAKFTAQGSSFHFGDDDVSIVGVALLNGQTITLDVDFGTGGIDPINTRIWVIDAKGKLKASNDDAAALDPGSTSTFDSRLNFTATSTGIYYIAVSQKFNAYVDNTFTFNDGGGDGGDFVLNMTFNSLPALTVGTAGDDSVTLAATDLRYDALGGNDTVTATEEKTRVSGGAGNDRLFTAFGVGTVFLFGEDGDDQLSGAGGNDVLVGGIGNDQFNGNDGNDQLFGGSDGDFASGGAGADLINGGAGQDFLQGDSGNDTIKGGTGTDNLRGGTNDDLLQGGGGNDALNGSIGKDTLDGGAGIDTAQYFDAASRVTIDLRLAGFQNTSGAGLDKLIDVENVSGTPFNDILIGNNEVNNLSGDAGDDSLTGLGGDDQLFDFNGGNDVMNGGDGNDSISDFGGGNDVHNGNKGNDNINSGDGDDILSGGDDNDSLFDGGGGDDRLNGDAGNDFMDDGGGGDDVFDGGAGNDFIRDTGSGADVLKGGVGSDTLRAGVGDDKLSGGDGIDFLDGEAGTDTLTGGQQADQFFFFQASGSLVASPDQVTDFSHAQGDHIDLQNVFGGTLTFIGAAAFSGAAGEVQVLPAGGDQAVNVNLDGNAATIEMKILVHSGTTLEASDFFL
jgi:Ca2+-binding RTX toxin-like protein